MIKWDDAVKRALYVLQNKDKYAYFYGAKGALLTDEVMERLWRAEPTYFSKYSAAQKKAIFDYSRGKIGFDCSGFVGYITGDMTYSGSQWSHCTVKVTDVFEGVAGSIVYMPGHIGFDIGYGYYLHFPCELKTCELGRFKDNTVGWTGSGQHKNIDYDGANNR